MRRIHVYLSAPLVLVSSLACAQEIIPETVITATRAPTAIEDIPAGVTVIDRATIEERGYTTLVDALSAVPGLHIVQSGGPGSQSSLFVRGGDSNQVLVLRDGVPINDPSSPSGAFDFGSDRLEDVERIEIVRGPMSGAYGTGAIMGVVNLISRQGSGALHGSTEAERASGPGAAGRASLGGKSGMVDYQFSLDGTNNAGYDPTPQRMVGVYNATSEPFSAAAGSLNLGINPDADTRIGLFVRGTNSYNHFNDDGYPIYDNAMGLAHVDTLFGRLSATTKLREVWQTTLSLAGNHADRRYSNPLDPNDPNQALEDSRYHARRGDLQWNNIVSLPSAGPLSAGTLTFGYEHIADTANIRVNNASFGYPYQDSVNASSDTNAGWLGLQGTLYKRLDVSMQLRDDAVSRAGNVGTWRTGAVLNIPELSSRLHASYGTGFLAPSLFQLYGVDSYGYLGNPSLRPERSEGYELGIAVDIPAAGRNDVATISATWFDSQVHDLIVTQYGATGSSPVNASRAHLDGVETTLTVRAGQYGQLDATYTYTMARDVTDHSTLLRRPQNQASIDLRATPIPCLTIVPELLLIGGFSDYLIDNTGNGAGVGPAPGATLLNLTVTYDITPHLAVYLRGRNLTNARFEPASGYQSPGRWIVTGLRVTL